LKSIPPASLLCIISEAETAIKFSLAITEEERGWTVYLDKYECRVAASVLGKILNQCEFP